MLLFNLDPIFRARGIKKPFAFLVQAGISPTTSHAITSGSARSMKLDHVELICRVLVCEPNDILLWNPGKSTQLPAGHPLRKLEAAPDDALLGQHLETMPYSELKKASKALSNPNTPETE